MDNQTDPLADCIVCLTGNPPIHIKHSVVIEGLPLCHTHAEDAMGILLLGKGDFR